MRKLKKNQTNRIKRKNQNSRKRALSAKKRPSKSFIRKKAEGGIDIKDRVMPITKALHPNQAIPKSIY